MSVKSSIEQAALAIFVQSGVDATTTKAIAKAAGVSEGALYRHYSGKDAMALELFMGVHRRLSSLIAEAAQTEATIHAKVDAIVRAYCQVADEDWLRFSFHLLSIHHFLPYYQEDGKDPVTVVENLIKQAMIKLELPPGDPRLLAAMAIGAISQVAQNKAYARLGDDSLSTHAPAMTTAVRAILASR